METLNSLGLGLFSAVGGVVIFLLFGLKSRKETSVDGKVLLITGASSGIGKACAIAFFGAGCKVILCGRNINKLAETKEFILTQVPSGKSCDIDYVQLDLEDYESIQTGVHKAESIFGQIDILINNGGISYRGKALETDIAVDRKLMEIDYFGQVALTKEVIPAMVKRNSGHIVAVSSIQGLAAIPYRSSYTAAKHALQAFFDSLRAELYLTAIEVTVVSPGYVKTSLSLNAVTGTGSSYGRMDETTARGQSPESVASKILAAVRRGEKNLVLAKFAHRVIVCIRYIFPGIYFRIMNYYAKQQNH